MLLILPDRRGRSRQPEGVVSSMAKRSRPRPLRDRGRRNRIGRINTRDLVRIIRDTLAVDLCGDQVRLDLPRRGVVNPCFDTGAGEVGVGGDLHS